MFNIFDGPPREWRGRIGRRPCDLPPAARERYECNLRLAISHHQNCGAAVVPFRPEETATGWTGSPLELWDGGNIEAQFLRHVQVQPLPGVRGQGILPGAWLPGASRPTEQIRMASPAQPKAAPAPEKSVAIEPPSPATASPASPYKGRSDRFPAKDSA